MPHRASMHTARLFLAMAAGALLIVTGCSHTPPPSPPVKPVVIVPQPAFTGHVIIYKVATHADAAQADANDLVPVPISIDAGSKEPAKLALQALIDCTDSPLPQGTKLLDVKIDKSSGLATLNFSKEFQTNFKGGDTREAQVLNSVRETMGQFPAVESVQFLVAGQKIGSLGGMEDLTDPLPVIKIGDASASGT